MKKISLAVLLFLFLNCSNANSNSLIASDEFTQSIQVINLLANSHLADPGMTPTAILVKYFNGGKEPCWMNQLPFRNDVTIHSGPTQGCIEKVNKIIISALPVADKLKTYQGEITVDIDTNKYANQLTVGQEQAPIFDKDSGLVADSGTLKVNIQAQFR